MRHPDFNLQEINPVVGLGLVATTFIPKGTILYYRDSLDIVLPLEHVYFSTGNAGDYLRKYVYISRKNEAVLCWDDARFVNHSCDFNAASLLHEHADTCNCQASIAIRDIQPGEQWCEDYAQYIIDSEVFDCACSNTNCRKKIHSSVSSDEETAKINAQRNNMIQQAIPHIPLVSQPLLANTGSLPFSMQCPLSSFMVA